MLDYPLSLLARVLDARLQGDGEAVIRDVAVDSRKVKPGDLFVALPGERVDGHRFVRQALAQGAVAALVNPHRLPAEARSDLPLLQVADPLLALGALGAWHRNRFPVRVIAVTGSVGKTTTKDFVAGVLAQRYRTLKSPGNLNTEIGLPLTLLRLEPRHQALVVELAMRGPGQIRALARLARPEAAVITNIGLSHIEVLGSQQAIAAAKAEVLDFLPAGGMAVLNADDAHFDFLRSRVPSWAGVTSFGFHTRADVTGHYGGVRTGVGRSATSGTRLTLYRERASPQSLTLPLLGRHNAGNALAAAAVGAAFGVSAKAVGRGLERAEISGQRMSLRQTARGLILDDTYNASSPETMEAALAVLAEVPGGRKVAVLGDMLELGRHAAPAHRRVGKAVAARPPDLLVTVGPGAALIAGAARSCPRVVRCDTRAEALAALLPELRWDDVVLVKGSRGMEMEHIVTALAGEA